MSSSLHTFGVAALGGSLVVTFAVGLVVVVATSLVVAVL